MRLCTFEVRTVLGRFERLGALTPNGIVDLNSAFRWHCARRGDARPEQLALALVPSEIIAFLEGGDQSFEAARSALASIQAEVQAGRVLKGPKDERILFEPDEVKLLAPVPRPRSLRDFYAFEQHVKTGFARRGMEVPKQWYDMPVYYKSGHHNIIGTGEDVRWPSFTQKFDYELEIAVVIGRKGRNVPAADAMSYIAGFTVMNDFSARDIQKQEMAVMLGPAKGKDWCTAIGPVLVTPDEIGDPYNLKMTARINGEVWSEGHSGSIFHRFDRMIEFLSMDDTILPGDVIGSGTVGTGCGLELDRWVKRGDVIELEIERIGILRNRVV